MWLTNCFQVVAGSCWWKPLDTCKKGSYWGYHFSVAYSLSVVRLLVCKSRFTIVLPKTVPMARCLSRDTFYIDSYTTSFVHQVSGNVLYVVVRWWVILRSFHFLLNVWFPLGWTTEMGKRPSLYYKPLQSVGLTLAQKALWLRSSAGTLIQICCRCFVFCCSKCPNSPIILQTDQTSRQDTINDENLKCCKIFNNINFSKTWPTSHKLSHQRLQRTYDLAIGLNYNGFHNQYFAVLVFL